MVRTPACGFNAETVFKSLVCDFMGLDGRGEGGSMKQ